MTPRPFDPVAYAHRGYRQSVAMLAILGGATIVGLTLILCAAVVADWVWMHTLHTLLSALTVVAS